MAELLSLPARLSNRRAIVAGLICGPLAARANTAGFAIDWQGGERTPAVAQALAAQIALVRRLPIEPAVMAFFAAQRITVDREAGTKTRAGPNGMFLARRAFPPDDPVLLHELIHRWQLMRMPGGARNADVHRLYDQARASGRFPPNAYMLRNAFEYFAMTASVVLHGRASRPPFLRATVREKAPDSYAFIVDQFGFRAPPGTSSTTSSWDSNAGHGITNRQRRVPMRST